MQYRLLKEIARRHDKEGLKRVCKVIPDFMKWLKEKDERARHAIKHLSKAMLYKFADVREPDTLMFLATEYGIHLEPVICLANRLKGRQREPRFKRLSKAK